MQIKIKIILLYIISAFIILNLFTGCSQTSETSKTNQANKNSPSDQVKSNNNLTSKKTYQKQLTKWLRPYKIDIQQGNILTADMLSSLKIGMTKQQTRHLLGTSVLTDNFDQDQWIYTFTDAKKGKIQKEQSITLSFKENKINDIKENIVVN